MVVAMLAVVLVCVAWLVGFGLCFRLFVLRKICVCGLLVRAVALGFGFSFWIVCDM